MRKAIVFVLAIVVGLSSYCKPKRNSMFAQLRTSRLRVGTGWITTNHIRRIVPTTTSGLPPSFSPSPEHFLAERDPQQELHLLLLCGQ